MSFGGSMLNQVIVALIGVAAVGAAQSTNSCPPVAAEPYLRCQVDRAAVPDTSNPAPRYPDMLRQARASGSARLSFVVDTNGRVDLKSVSVLEAPHELFSVAAKMVLNRWRFAPALKNGVPVATRVDQVFDFRLSPIGEAPPQPIRVLARDTTADGVQRIRFGEMDRDPNAGSRFTSNDLLAAQRTALLSVAPAPVTDSRDRPLVTVCVTMMDGAAKQDADSATLAGLTVLGRRAVGPQQCPKTYGGMILRLDRPKGWVDPYIMTVERVLPWTDDMVAVTIDVWQGAAGDMYRCSVPRVGGSPNCLRIRSMIS